MLQAALRRRSIGSSATYSKAQRVQQRYMAEPQHSWSLALWAPVQGCGAVMGVDFTDSAHGAAAAA